MIHYRPGTSTLTPPEMLEKAMRDLNSDFDLYCEDKYLEGKPHWAMDNYRLGGTIGKGVSHLFYTQPGWGLAFEKEFGRNKIKCVTYAVDEEIYPEVKSEKIYDVGFIGTFNDNDGRYDFIENLKSKFNCFISSELATHKITEELAKCRVLVNHIRYEEINIRFFECMASGAQVVSYSPALSLFAQEGIHYLTFKTPDEAVEKIQFLLDHPEVAEKMTKEARKHVLANHTYKHRVKEMIAFL